MALPLQDDAGNPISLTHPLPVYLGDNDGNELAKSDGGPIGASLLASHGIPVSGQSSGTARIIRVNERGSVRAQDTLLFEDSVEGATLNSLIWTSTATTMTSSQATGQIVLNTANTLTINTGIMLVSNRRFPLLGRIPLHARWRVNFNWVSGQIQELGFGAPATAITAVPDGIFLRVNEAGALYLVHMFAGAEVPMSLGASIGSGVSASAYYEVELFADDDSARIVIRDNTNTCVVNTTMSVATGNIRLSTATHLPTFLRVWNLAATSTGSQMKVSRVGVSAMESDLGADWGTIMAGIGRGSLVQPLTYAQAANYANSAAPASATLSNTAAGYTVTDGQWQFAAVGGAATDYCLFGVVVPSPYTMIVRGIRISAWVTGAAIATTPTLLQWGISSGAAVTLASNTIRKTVGAQTLPVGLAVGTSVEVLDVTFKVPLIVYPGRFIQTILKMPVATATASSVIGGCTYLDYHYG